MKRQTHKRKTARLDAQEREIERAVARGEYVSIPNPGKEIARAKQVARNTFAKSKTINIRVTERDLVRLRARAHREGVPYQTIVSSLIRQATR